MSMITGCPACGTMFRVVPDQLKISEGWVRCGHCAEVFDATAHLQPQVVARPSSEEGDLAASPAPQTVVEPALPESPQPAPAPAAEPEGEAFAAEEVGPLEVAHPDVEVIEVESPYSEFPSSLGPASVQPREDEPGYLPPEDEGGSNDVPLRFRVEDVDSDVPDSALREPGPASDLDQVSFVRQARRKAFWRRPAVRALLLLGVLVLGALLALQYAMRERDRLAAVHPQWRPMLERLCEPFACQVGPPQSIESILIDNSGFTRLRADTYRLSFTLKNQSNQPVALPALQLTLTDTQDQAVLQRVLRPPELGATADTLAPASEWSASVALAVNPAGGAGRIAGYRLLAFYP